MPSCVMANTSTDPLNARQVSNGLGATNHFFSMPEAVSTTLFRPIKGFPRGEVTRHVITRRYDRGRASAPSICFSRR